MRRQTYAALLLVGVITAAVATAGTWILTGLALLADRRQLAGGHGLQWLWLAVTAGGALAAVAATALARVVAAALTRQLAGRLAPLTDLVRLGRRGASLSRPASDDDDDVGQVARAVAAMADELMERDARRQEFLAEVAHDLRTPLTMVGGQVEAMLDGVVPTDAEQLGRLADEVSRLDRLVGDLLELAVTSGRAGALQRRPLDLAALARSLEERFAPLAEARGVHLAVMADRTLTVTADADRLTQVLVNLLANALAHTPAGGSVQLTVAQEAGGARLEVADTGSGMTPELVARVTEPLVRGPASRGAGLGLAIARAWTEAHGGHLVIASRPGEGTQVTVTLPA